MNLTSPETVLQDGRFHRQPPSFFLPLEKTVWYNSRSASSSIQLIHSIKQRTSHAKTEIQLLLRVRQEYRKSQTSA